jgi:hypothetical protein
MKAIELVLLKSGGEGIFGKNINPLRCGIMLYSLISEIEEKFNHSE